MTMRFKTKDQFYSHVKGCYRSLRDDLQPITYLWDCGDHGTDEGDTSLTGEIHTLYVGIDGRVWKPCDEYNFKYDPEKWENPFSSSNGGRFMYFWDPILQELYVDVEQDIERQEYSENREAMVRHMQSVRTLGLCCHRLTRIQKAKIMDDNCVRCMTGCACI